MKHDIGTMSQKTKQTPSIHGLPFFDEIPDTISKVPSPIFTPASPSHSISVPDYHFSNMIPTSVTQFINISQNSHPIPNIKCPVDLEYDDAELIPIELNSFETLLPSSDQNQEKEDDEFDSLGDIGPLEMDFFNKVNEELSEGELKSNHRRFQHME